MQNLIKRSVWILVLVFFICASILTETISVYTSTFNPAGGNIVVSTSKNINIYLHEVSPLQRPTVTDKPTKIKSNKYGVISNKLPTVGSNDKYRFLGWYTYDFDTAQYGSTAYKAGDKVNASDLDNNNNLVLFEKYGGYIVNVNAEGNGSYDIDDLGIQLEIVNGVGTITGVTDNVSDVIIPGTVTDQDGNEIKITNIEKPDDNKWEEVTSIVFMEPSNITTIAKDSMEGLENIKSIVLPSSLVEIEESALLCLENLEWIIVPENVLKMGKEAFKDVPSSCKIYCEATSKPSGWKNGWVNARCTVYWGIGVQWNIDNNGVPKAI